MLRTLRALSITLAACWLFPAADSAAERGAEMSFEIPAQSLDGALNALAEAAGVQLSYPGALSEGLRSPALSGHYTVDQALGQLLEGTGLGYRFVDDRTLTLQRPNPLDALLAEVTKPRQYAGAAEPPPKKPEAPPKQDAEEITVLPPLTVTGKAWDETSYNVQDASTATKTDTPIMETPFSVQVVPRQVLDDQQVIRLEKALENVSGVVRAGVANQGDRFIIRGFGTSTVYRDGVLFPDSFSTGQNRGETANLARIEVLKGPGSILYGRAEPGGIINLVTKQPLESPDYSLQQQFGSFDFYRTTLDATGPITPDDTLLYRFNLAYQNAGSFREFVDSERVFVAPVLRWNISPRTQATLELEYLKDDYATDPGVPPMGNRPAPIPRERNLSEPFTGGNEDRTLVGLHWSHAFSEQWTLRHRFNFDNFESDDRTGFFFFGPPAADGTIDRGFFTDDSFGRRYFTSVDLTGKFELGGLRHTLLLGGDYFRQDIGFTQICCPSLPINIFRPVHIGEPPPTDPSSAGKNDTTGSFYGLFLQDQVELPYKLFALGGFRYDNAEEQNNLRGTTQEEDRLSPRGGLLWRPIPALSLYGSYTENFGASNGFNLDGKTVLPPETAQQWELGVKTELADGRLTATLAYFDLTKQNISVPDPTNPLFSRTIGEAESRGVELDVAGEILPGWRVIGAYAYLPFAEITKDVGFDRGPGNQGNRFFIAPRHAGSLWSTYEFLGGDLAGAMLGAGVVAVDDREGDPENSFQLPGYAIVNLLASYEWKLGPTKLTAQLNVDNVLDKTYFASGNGAGQNFFGAPRPFLGSIRVEF